jgi:hypothetical protein
LDDFRAKSVENLSKYQRVRYASKFCEDCVSRAKRDLMPVPTSGWFNINTSWRTIYHKAPRFIKNFLPPQYHIMDSSTVPDDRHVGSGKQMKAISFEKLKEELSTIFYDSCILFYLFFIFWFGSYVILKCLNKERILCAYELYTSSVAG